MVTRVTNCFGPLLLQNNMLAAVARNVPRRALRPSGSRLLAQNSNLPSLDFSPESEHTTGAKSSKDSLSSVEKKRRTMGRISLAVLVLGFGINAAYMGREWDEVELKAKKLVGALSRSSV